MPDPETTTTRATTTTTSTTSTTVPERPALTPEIVNATLGPAAQAWLAAPSGSTYDALAAAAASLLDTHRLGNTDVTLPDGFTMNDDGELFDADGEQIFEFELSSFLVPDEVSNAYRAVYGRLLSVLATYPGNDPIVWSVLDDLGIPGTPIRFGSGVYLVGTGQDMVPPGTYVVERPVGNPFDGCYWETLDSSGNIIDNNFIGQGFRVVADVSSRAYSVEFDDCGTFVKQ